MAVTKICVIREQLEKTVQYAANEKKTSLDGVIDYAVNPDKTEQRLFESCLNCGSVATAYADMARTKQRFNKNSGVLGYHFIQSFQPGELTPEQTHAIGVEFAERLFGDHFEVVVGTHLDKSHLHNHIVVNSVSFQDGKKLRCNMDTYFNQIQKISDDLCREHGLSVITPKGKGLTHQEWQAKAAGKPTIRSQLRADVDSIIAKSLNFTTFLDALKKSGYEVKYGNVKHTAVRPPYSKRFIRLDSLGEHYTDAAIEQRILQQRTWSRKQLQQPKCRYRCKGSIHKAKKHTGFTALYFHYVYLLRGAVKGTGRKKVSRFLLEDTIKFDRYLAQHKFLVQNHIDTTADLLAVKTALQAKIESAVAERKPLYDERRIADEPQKEALSQQIAAHTSRIKSLRHNFRLCQQIETGAERVRGRVHDAQKIIAKEELNHESRQRSRRADDPRGYPNLRGGSEIIGAGGEKLSRPVSGAGKSEPEVGGKNEHEAAAEKRERTADF